MYYVFVQLINRLSIYFAGSGAFVLAESGTFVLAGSGAFGAWVGLLRGSGLRAVWQCGSGLSGSVAADCVAVWQRIAWLSGSGLRVVWQCGSGLRGCVKSVAATQLDKPLQILSLILGKRIAFAYTADGSNGVSFAQVDQPDTLGSTSCHTDVAYGHADGNT